MMQEEWNPKEEAWGFEDDEEVSLEDVKKLCDELQEKRKAEALAEDVAKAAGAEVKRLEGKLLNFLKAAGLTSFKTPTGQFIITKRRSFSQPDGPENREKFFQYLREQNLFDQMITVNSRTLSSWATKEIEAREEAGEVGWVPPGLKPASEFESISVKKV